MGEATYYAKIWYSKDATHEELWLKMEKIADFLKEGSKSHDFWQANRWHERKTSISGDHRWRGMFWAKFSAFFPNVYRMLQEMDFELLVSDLGGERFGFLADGGCNNDLSGKLGFGDVDDEDETESLLIYDLDEVYIGYSAMVWHFAEWDHIFQFLCRETGGEEYNWISDEYVNYMDLVQRKG